MHDRPTAIELLEAVRHFLETDVVPALEGPKKFHARVAANLMNVLSREWTLEETHLRDEWESLAKLGIASGAAPSPRDELKASLKQSTESLCEKIRNGDADGGGWREDVLRHLRLVVRQKLEVANPAMLERG